MNARWSLIKRFGSITYEDFIMAAKSFCVFIPQHRKEIYEVSITFYRELPHSVTALEEGIYERVDTENKRKRLAETIGLENVTKELFDQAVNVHLRIRKKKGDGGSVTCGHMECKGLLPRHFVFWAVPDTLGWNELIWDFPPQLSWRGWLRFKKGDGFEHLHPYSLS